MEALIAQGLEELGLTAQVPDQAPAQLAEYGRLLLEKNQVMNLTAIREEDRSSTAPHAGLRRPALLCGLFRGKPSSTWAPGRGFPAWP